LTWSEPVVDGEVSGAFGVEQVGQRPSNELQVDDPPF
jgi:hypothetical protein